MVVEGEADEVGSFCYIVPVDAGGEICGLHFFDDAFCFEVHDGAAGPDVDAGGDEAGEFVAGEEVALDGGGGFDAGFGGVVGGDGLDDFGVDVFFLEEGHAPEGVVFGVLFVVEVVEEAGDAPLVLVGVLEIGVVAHAGFDGEHVSSEGVAGGVGLHELEGFGSGHGVEFSLGWLEVKVGSGWFSADGGGVVLVCPDVAVGSGSGSGLLAGYGI